MPNQEQNSQPSQDPPPKQHAIGDVINPASIAPDHESMNKVAISPQPSDSATINTSAPQNTQYTPASNPEIVSASSMQDQPAAKSPRRFRFSKKTSLVTAAAIFLLAGGGAAAYIGYYVPNKPENVWRTALTNTQKGYDKLSAYATAKKNIHGLNADGTFKLSGPAAVDGTFKGQSDGKNGELTGSTSALGLKINYDVKAISSSGNTPDIYFKIDGIQGLGSLVGQYLNDPSSGIDNSKITTALNGLNGQWYFVDHTLFDQFAQGSNGSLQFNSADVSELLNAVGSANRQYIFTNDPSKMAIVEKQELGKEKQDGRSVYHYKIGVDKGNLNAYGKTLCGNLVKTKFFKVIEGSSTPDTDLIQNCQRDLGLDKADTSRTADAWVDLHTKLFHKIRFTSKSSAQSYVDISQDYQGGNVFPFSITTHDSTNGDVQTSSLNMKLNMSANTFSMDGDYSDSQSKAKGTLSLSVAPSTQTVNVTKPASSKTIIQLLNDLGLSDLTSSTNSTPSVDNQRKDLANRFQAEIETYAGNNQGSYPFKSGAGCSSATVGCWAAFYKQYINPSSKGAPIDDRDSQTKTSIFGPNPAAYAPLAYSPTINSKLPVSGSAILVYGAKCNGEKITNSGSASTSGRAYAIVIGLSSPNSWYCTSNS